MVRNYIRKTDRAATYTKEQLLEAVHKVKIGELTAYRAAIAYKIPRATIVARVYERYGLKSNSLGRNTVIPEEKEKKLANNLHDMEKYGFGLTRTEIMELVGDYVSKNCIENPFKNGIPGEDWFLAFKKRHNLAVKKPQAVENSRKKACNPWVIYSYYELLKNTMDELGLHNKPSQIWNLDETSFSKDPSKTKVVGLRGFASTRTIASPGKDNTTVLLGCSAAGDKTPPLIIFKGKNLWDEWTSEEDYPGTVYAATKNGWMETDVFETFFVKVFLPTVGQKRPILLVYDGHSTHVGINIIEKAREAGITIMKIPPHTSDNLQPLDLAVNKSFKDKWDVTLVKWQRLHVGQVLPKKEFSKLIGVVWAQVDPKVCVAGFRKAGIFPFDSNAVPEWKFNPNQLVEWKKQQEQSSGSNETFTSTNILKNLDRDTVDQPLSDPSCSKNQLTRLRRTKIQSGSNVVFANDPSKILIPSLCSICLNYWNYAIERTIVVQDHITEIKSASYDRLISLSCIDDVSQSSTDFTLNQETSQQNEHQQNNQILQPITCNARNLKNVTLDHDIYPKNENNAKTSSLKSAKVTIIDDRRVASNITFEELLLQKIKAGGHSKQKRTKIAGGAEVITSEDVYKKQKNIAEEKLKKLKLREEKLASKLIKDENTKTKLYKDKKKMKTEGSTSESEINTQLKDKDNTDYDDKMKLRQLKKFENSHRKKYMKRKISNIKKIKKNYDSTSESDIEIKLMDDSDIEDSETWITEDSTSENEVNNQSKDETNIKDSTNIEENINKHKRSKKINSYRNKERNVKEISECDIEIDLMDSSDIYDGYHYTINNKENYDDEFIENDYDEPPTSTVEKGQWVLVKFSSKTSVKHYVGVVTDVNCDSIPTVKYARKSIFRSGEGKNTFVFPHVPDICDVRHLEDIVCKLPKPMIDRRGKISFKISFEGYNVQ